MGSDESPFNVSLTVRDKVTRQCPQTTTFEENSNSKLLSVAIITIKRKFFFAHTSSATLNDVVK